MRETLFLVILSVLLLALLAKSRRVMMLEGADCPPVVGPCILPQMIDALTEKVAHQQSTLKQYIKEITDIENRYPISFQVEKVDTNTDSLSWVAGVLPYPTISFHLKKPLPGPIGPNGPQGPVGLSHALPAAMGIRGQPGYFGVPK